MEHLPKKIHQNGISYTLVGDYYIPDLELPEESRPIGRWGPDAQSVSARTPAPASTMPCFCRENSGHILLT